MESQRAELYFGPLDGHDDAVAVSGLDDLFNWASETVAEGLDGRARKAKEQRAKRQVLNIIHRSAELQAKAKHADELAYLQRRVIALQGALAESQDELVSLKQVVIAQFYGLQRIPELEEKLVQVQATSLNKEEVEEERKHLMNALSKLKKERDFLEEVVTVNESENTRLSKLYNESKNELSKLKNRRWWHLLFPPK